MDTNNWRPAPGGVGGGGGGGEPTMDAGDWRSQLQPDLRQGTVNNKIMDPLKRHLPFSGQDGLQELKRIAVRFEEKIYTSATSQPDYLGKISLKMLTMETKSQNTMTNALPSNSGNTSKNPSDTDTRDLGSGFEGSMAEASALKEAQRKERAERKRKEAEKAAASQPGYTPEADALQKKPRTPDAVGKETPRKAPSGPSPPPHGTPADAPLKEVAQKDKQAPSATLDATPSVTERDEPWVPVIQTSSGEPVKKNASVRESRKTTMTLLKALALPRDMKAVPKHTADNYADLCTSIVRAGQSALALGDKVYNLGVEKGEVEMKLEAEQKKAGALAADGQELEKLLAEARRLQGEAEERAVTAESKVTAAEERAVQAERDLKHAQADHDEMMAA